jgi:cytochrome c-type biogenesis protein CcmH
MTDPVAALRQQLQQLDGQLAQGKLSAAAHAASKAEIERKIVDAVLAESPAARPGTRLVALLAAGVLALAGAGYAVKGSPGMPSAGPPGTARAPADEAVTEAQFTQMVEQLSQKLKEKPDNAEGWAMLARSYTRLNRPADAVPAFAKAVALNGNDAQLLTDYADLLAFQNNRTLAGEPLQLVERALKIDPKNPKALALAGSGAFERKDYAGAVKFWEELASIAPPGSEFMAQLQGGIDEARKLGGLPPSAAAKAPAAAAVGPAAAASSAAAAAPAAVRVTGTVRLSPALAAQASPEDTVFVLARPADGSRMPLAVAKHRVKDLPLQFSLDDSMAMAPAARLSLHERVVVVARISKSGQAVPAAGDISGQSQPVSNNSRDLVIELSEVVK